MERAIEASTMVQAPLATCRDVLIRCAPTLVGAPAPGDGTRTRAVLRVDTAGGGASLHQTVDCEIGRPRATAECVKVHVRWQPIDHERWLPEFDGELEATQPTADGGATLVLHGFYTVPLGLVGRFGDGVAGRRIARRSLAAFLADVASRIDQAVGSTGAGAAVASDYPVDVREPVDPPDNHIG